MHSDLYVLCECPEDLLGHFESLEKVLPPLQVDGLVVGVVPVEVRDGLLQPQQVVHGAHNDVDGCGVACLRAQVILEGQVVALAQELQEAEERDGELETR